MNARMLGLSGMLIAAFCAGAAKASAAPELVVYDAARDAARACSTGALFSVTGSWDISSYGSFEIDLDTSLEPTNSYVQYRVSMENLGAIVTRDRKLNRASGVFLTTAFFPQPTNSFARPIPPHLPAFEACVARMSAVEISGLFNLIWPSPYWNGRDAGWGNGIEAWTLDPRRVVRISVEKILGEKSFPPRIRRIVMKGSANRVRDLPSFARLEPDRFFPFMDRFGQFKFREWPGKVHAEGELADAIAREDAELAAHPAPKDHDKWGGWKDGPRFEATGHFYVKKVDGKWWFVDPDGYLWWSHGPVRVSPSCAMTPILGREDYFEDLPAADSPFAAFYKTRDELLWPYYVRYGVTNTYDFSAANLYRKYGSDWVAKWADRAHRRLKSWGANTIANSSDIRVMKLSRTPYCDRFELKSRPLESMRNTTGWWPVRDPFDPSFRADLKRQLAAHKEELDDPWCFGFFVDNELPWGTEESLGRNVWLCPDDQPAKIAFRRYLAERGKTASAEPSKAECAAFAKIIVEEYFRLVRDEFKAAAPNKLYLGCRFSGGYEFVHRACAKYADVLSFNYYRPDLKAFPFPPKDIDKPVIIGEFHMGALDRGPFRAGLIELPDQQARAEGYKRYLVSALEDPRFVGAHWHQWSDDVSTGRFDGENFQIGWVDICDNPYPETIAAVRWVGANMYRIRHAAKPVERNSK